MNCIPKMLKFGCAIFAASMLVIANQAGATGFSGAGDNIGLIRVSTEDDGTLRVGVQISVTTACPVQGFFTTTTSQDVSVRSAWLKALQDAKTNFRGFSIVGTGTCDAKNVEIIKFIDLN